MSWTELLSQCYSLIYISDREKTSLHIYKDEDVSILRLNIKQNIMDTFYTFTYMKTNSKKLDVDLRCNSIYLDVDEILYYCGCPYKCKCSYLNLPEINSNKEFKFASENIFINISDVSQWNEFRLINPIFSHHLQYVRKCGNNFIVNYEKYLIDNISNKKVKTKFYYTIKNNEILCLTSSVGKSFTKEAAFVLSKFITNVDFLCVDTLNMRKDISEIKSMLGANIKINIIYGNL